MNVDGSSYCFLGTPDVPSANFQQATQKSAEVRTNLAFFQVVLTFPQFTSTQSLFVLTAGGIDLTVSFLSPVEVAFFSVHHTLHAYRFWLPAERSAQPIHPLLLHGGIGGVQRRRLSHRLRLL